MSKIVGNELIQLMTGRSIQASPKGIQLAKKALNSKRWKQTNLIGEVCSSRSTISKFFNGRSVDSNIFIGLCEQLGLDWQQIADLPKEAEPAKEKQNQKNNIDIDALVQEVRSKVKPSVQERCGTMRVLDMTQPIRLDDIYTDVNILEKITGHRRMEIASLLQGFDPENFDRFGLGRVEKRVPGLEAVEYYSKLMVLGKPGSGKTTFLKHIAIQCVCGEFQANQVPIFITLKQFAEAKGQPSLLAYISQMFEPYDVTTDEVEQFLRDGRSLVLLDGLDEVREEDNSRVLKQIQSLSGQYHTNQFVISCRIAAREYTFEKFTEVEVADFDENQIAVFTDKWFRAKDPAKAEKFMKKLGENEPIQELATNPLLLTLLCLVFEEAAEFPLNRSRLYKEGLDVLLKKWDLKRNIEREQVYKKLDSQRKEDLLSLVAQMTFEHKEYFFKQEQVEQYIFDYIYNLPDAQTDPEALRLDSEAVLKSIEMQHGLLVERARGIYSFSHLTFQEYFTARAIVTSSNPYTLNDKAMHNLVRHIYDKRWREVFLLFVGMVKNANILLLLMKYQVDGLAAQHRYLQELLTWANKKARTVSVSCPYKSVAIRAFYLCLASGISMMDSSTPPFFEDWRIQEINGLIASLAPTISFDFEYGGSTGFSFGNIRGSLDRSLSLDFDLNHARVHASLLGRIANSDDSDFADNHFLDDTHFYAIADALYNSLTCSIDSNLKESLALLYTQLPDDIYKQEGLYEQWSKTHSQSWAEELRGVINKYRNIDCNWQFSNEQWRILRAYCYANNLLIDCLNSDCYVSREVRQEIEDTLLLPIAKIENDE